MTDADPGDGLLQREAVARVQRALRDRGSAAQVIALAASARTAADAAQALGCPTGAIVKSLIFACAGEPLLALVAGDRRCDTVALARALDRAGPVDRASADLVRAATGQSIGGVAPLGHPRILPAAMDTSLERFALVYAAAGHPNCVFAIAPAELMRLAGARRCAGLGRE